jgi:hypothetical protein
MEYYTNNKTSHFTVKLPKILTLDGKWSVGLAEIYYPNTFLNIAPENNKIFFKWKTDRYFEECVVEVKNFDSVEDLLNRINQCVVAQHDWKARFISEKQTKNTKFLEFNQEKTKIMVNSMYKAACSEIIFQNRLGLVLGFEPNVNVLSIDENYVRKPHLWYGIPDEMMVYTDIIEPQVIAHQMAKIIRIVNVNKESLYEETSHKEFKRIQYFPLLKKEFDNISVELRDRTGQFLPFQYGNATLVLHFMKLE